MTDNNKLSLYKKKMEYYQKKMFNQDGGAYTDMLVRTFENLKLEDKFLFY